MDSVLHFDAQQNYDCIQCGRGCRAGWDIPVEPEVVARLKDHPLTLRVIHERGSAFRVEDDRTFIQSSKDCKECGFLEENQLCGIHRELGFEAKPATCKMFPFVVTQTPDGLFVGTTYYCSAVRQNVGRSSSEHEADLRTLLQDSAPVNQIARDGLVIHNRYYMTWKNYQAFEQELLKRIVDSGHQDALTEAVLAVATMMSQYPLLEEGAQPIGHRLTRCWETFDITQGLPILESLVNQQTLDYFKFNLDRNLWDAVEAALWNDKPMQLPHYNWSGTLSDLHRLVNARVGQEWDRRIERYLDHLIFRKALVVQPLLLASLCQLHMLPNFLKVHTALLAHQRGHAQSQEQDYFDALALCETYLVTHGKNRRIVNELAADGLVEQLRRG